MAQAIRLLFNHPERWIHRRVEHVYFKNHAVVRHKISVDFTLPPWVEPVDQVEGENVYIAPLFLLAKDSPKPMREGKRPRRQFLLFGPRPKKQVIPTAPCSNLDLTDENGRSLPLVTRRSINLLAATILLKEAERVLGYQPHGKLAEQIMAIPYRSWLNLEDIFKWLLEAGSHRRDPRRKLREDKPFTELVYILASHSIVAFSLTQPQKRSVYKLSYDEPANESKSISLSAFMRSLGLRSERYFVSLNEIGASASYHLELEIPDELEINAVNLVGKRYQWFDDLESKKNQDYAITQIGRVEEGNIYIPEPLPGRRVGLAWVKLRVRRTGFLISALATSLVITALLALAAYGAPNVLGHKESESATAALLLVPALVAALIARPVSTPSQRRCCVGHASPL
jgi:hypothetical protein